MQEKVLLVLCDVSPLPLEHYRITSSRGRIITKHQRHNCVIPFVDIGSELSKEHGREVPKMLETTENELGIRKWIEEQGHELITTSDKAGDGSTFEKHLVDTEVIITTP